MEIDTLLLIGYETHRIDLNIRLPDSDHFEFRHTLIGHEDWIRDLDICQPSNTQLLIASCSQDYYIRLWRLDATPIKSETVEAAKTTEISTEITYDNNDSDDEEVAAPIDQELKLKRYQHVLVQQDSRRTNEQLRLMIWFFVVVVVVSSRFVVYSASAETNVEYATSLESVLYGHEDWIYSVRFEPKRRCGPGEQKQPLTLISASMDKTLVVWTYNEENAVWIDVARAGDIGGTTLGFYGATFAPTGEYIVAHGYQGALHLWQRDLQSVCVLEFFFFAKFKKTNKTHIY